MLAQAIVREGLKNVAAGANPMGLKRGIEKAVDAIVEELKAQSKEVAGKEDIARVGTIVSREREIGDVIADAIEKVGKDGVVNVEEGQTFGLELEFTEGMQFDKGYLSPYMITDPERMEAELEEPYVLIANQKIGAVKDISRCSSRSSRPGGRCSSWPRTSRRVARGDRRQQAPRHVHRRRGEGAGLRRPPQADARGHRDHHGRRGHHRGDGPQAREHEALAARQGPQDRHRQGHDDDHRRRRRDRRDQGPHQAAEAGDREHRLRLRPREAPGAPREVSGGVAVVKVGAATETEIKEKKHRVEDALQATRRPRGRHRVERRRAPERPSATVKKVIDTLEGEEDRRGHLPRAREPLRQLAYNAGLEGSVVVDKVRRAKKGEGLNVETGEIENLVTSGIIDPTMVTRSALQNAASIAKNILTTEAVVAEMPEKQPAMPAGMPGGGMDF